MVGGGEAEIAMRGAGDRTREANTDHIKMMAVRFRGARLAPSRTKSSGGTVVYGHKWRRVFGPTGT